LTLIKLLCFGFGAIRLLRRNTMAEAIVLATGSVVFGPMNAACLS
jgi:hypothetical protein